MGIPTRFTAQNTWCYPLQAIVISHADIRKLPMGYFEHTLTQADYGQQLVKTFPPGYVRASNAKLFEAHQSL